MPSKKGKQKDGGTKKSRNLEDMSVDDLMAEDLDSDEDDEMEFEDDDKDERTSKSKKSERHDGGNEKSGKPSSIGKHKQSLHKLKDTDPEFYDFLQENEGGLLEFNESDASDMESDDEEDDIDEEEEEEEEEDEDDDDDDSDEGDFDTKKPEELDSDEEDFVDEDGEGGKKKKGGIPVTLALVDKWKQQLEDNSLKSLREVMKAFRAAVQQAGPGEDSRTKYSVDGSAAFNAVVTLCLKQVHPALQHALNLQDKSEKVAPSSSAKWKQLNMDIKTYLTNIMQLMDNVAEPGIVSVVLRHVRSLIPYFTCFPKLVKVTVKKLVNFWSTGEETVRVLAFLCLFSIVRCTRQSRLDFILKQMYLAYVRNTKFTSPSTLPVINFMQRSMTEMFALNTRITYQHAFVYIRQLAIHLRNAITVKKKDMYQSVYNWQYIHCIYLWCRVLATLHEDETLKPLVYPLVQTSIGVIKLIPAAKYFPLRFHVVRALNILSEATGTFIPLLPFILEVLQMADFNKKHATSSFKPLNFAVMLRLSNSQLKERAFKDGVIDQVYDLLMEHLQVHCHRIGFPELCLPVVLEIKAFNKKCKVANFTRQMKQLLDKVQENCQEITKRREKVAFGLADDQAVRAWERKSREEGTAILRAYQTYKKLRERELKHEEAGKDRMVDDKIPVISQSKKRKMEAKFEMKNLFKKDVESDDEEDLFSRVERKQKRLQEGKKKKRGSDDDDNDDDDDDDELEDLDEDDFADLSDDDDEEEFDEEEDDESDDFDHEEEEEEEKKRAKVGSKRTASSVPQDSSKRKKMKNQTKSLEMDDKEDEEDIVQDFALWSDDDGDDDDDGGKVKKSGKKSKKNAKSRKTSEGQPKGQVLTAKGSQSFAKDKKANKKRTKKMPSKK